MFPPRPNMHYPNGNENFPPTSVPSHPQYFNQAYSPHNQYQQYSQYHSDMASRYPTDPISRYHEDVPPQCYGGMAPQQQYLAPPLMGTPHQSTYDHSLNQTIHSRHTDHPSHNQWHSRPPKQNSEMMYDPRGIKQEIHSSPSVDLVRSSRFYVNNQLDATHGGGGGGGGARNRISSSRSVGDSSSSTSTSTETYRGPRHPRLTDEEIMEFAALIKDLWNHQRFAQEFKKYSVGDYAKIREMIEKIEAERKKRRRGM